MNNGGKIELVQFSSVTNLCLTFVIPWTAARHASLSITISQTLLKLMSIESVMPSNHLILYRPLLLLPSIFPSIKVLSNESVLCIVAKCLNFNCSISPSNEYSGLISFRMDGLILPTPCLADLPDPGLKLGSPALQADSLPTELQGKP